MVAHADDAAGRSLYADCSSAFNDAMGQAIYLGSGDQVAYSRLRLSIRIRKAKVVGEGLRLKVPCDLTWSCYEGGDKPCGVCVRPRVVTAQKSAFAGRMAFCGSGTALKERQESLRSQVLIGKVA